MIYSTRIHVISNSALIFLFCCYRRESVMQCTWASHIRLHLERSNEGANQSVVCIAARRTARRNVDLDDCLEEASYAQPGYRRVAQLRTRATTRRSRRSSCLYDGAVGCSNGNGLHSKQSHNRRIWECDKRAARHNCVWLPCVQTGILWFASTGGANTQAICVSQLLIGGRCQVQGGSRADSQQDATWLPLPIHRTYRAQSTRQLLRRRHLRTLNWLSTTPSTTSSTRAFLMTHI